jgi:hypothetical protein
MRSRRWIILLILSVVLACSIVAGARYYYSKCHGMDACAAVDNAVSGSVLKIQGQSLPHGHNEALTQMI